VTRARVLDLSTLAVPDIWLPLSLELVFLSVHGRQQC
jgi:hypothetical protein